MMAITGAPDLASRGDEGRPLDAQPDVPVVVYLEVWNLRLPFGTISRNDDFWKRVNEQCVDVATYDLLFKNGVRVGEAPIGEWDHFKTLIEDEPAVSKKTVFTGGEQAVEIGMREAIDSQNLFYFDHDNQLHGRTFDHCENLLSLSFQPAPRKLGSVRVALCPV
ncbi:MAG: hypothetical protein ACREIT_03050, partial [Tepidisphaeraceae bacterium]